MNFRALLLTAVLVVPTFAEEKPAAPPAEPAAPKVFKPGDLPALKEQVGKEVVIEGIVAGQGENKNGTIRYLNFSRNYKDTIALVFVLSRGEGFTKEKLSEFVGKKVRVTGKVETYNEALQIKIDKLEQIQLQP